MKTKYFQDYYWLVKFYVGLKHQVWAYEKTFITRKEARDYINDPHKLKYLYKIVRVHV